MSPRCAPARGRGGNEIPVARPKRRRMLSAGRPDNSGCPTGTGDGDGPRTGSMDREPHSLLAIGHSCSRGRYHPSGAGGPTPADVQRNPTSAHHRAVARRARGTTPAERARLRAAIGRCVARPHERTPAASPRICLVEGVYEAAVTAFYERDAGRTREDTALGAAVHHPDMSAIQQPRQRRLLSTGRGRTMRASATGEVLPHGSRDRDPRARCRARPGFAEAARPRQGCRSIRERLSR